MSVTCFGEYIQLKVENIPGMSLYINLAGGLKSHYIFVNYDLHRWFQFWQTKLKS